ncbi:UMP kinase [Cloacibacillus evryensis]|uniref:Uridylate kinase n=1 Tax=Cloacibacillus evryensis TaxID=508460 RepID=A0AAW5K693_9BACT|nr:UMP kinase [Cloacibacillus evryensis]EHL66053.1 UMP kinase [Synergistes sp. 3_1_syn1]EXG78906.1 uridylate kinase [Cloacibacillus evryensis DSM 19522]MCQ4763387.1 UMP kinase [Cloacibacillus evryensis]MCQ4813494.1 UMP kinase [Cloacibacillus evryensis]MEA5033799.1 UMP kinase [Cloacibacillus evryensis]
MERKYNRVLLKLSGEILAGDAHFGLDYEAIRGICEQIVEVAGEGIGISMVVGGGNIIRGAQTTSIERAQADYMGMLGTVINALALQDALERLGQPTRVQSAIEMRQIAETVIRRRAIRHLEKGRIVIFAAGTGSPYFSTDTTAALRASEIGADCLLKATKVDGIYDKDPAKFTGAVKMPHVSYMDALQMQLKVMDAAAFSLCQENKIPIVVFDVLKKGNLRRLLIDGENIGSMVS